MKKIASNRNYRLLKIKNKNSFNKLRKNAGPYDPEPTVFDSAVETVLGLGTGTWEWLIDRVHYWWWPMLDHYWISKAADEVFDRMDFEEIARLLNNLDPNSEAKYRPPNLDDFKRCVIMFTAPDRMIYIEKPPPTKAEIEAETIKLLGERKTTSRPDSIEPEAETIKLLGERKTTSRPDN